MTAGDPVEIPASELYQVATRPFRGWELVPLWASTIVLSVLARGAESSFGPVVVRITETVTGKEVYSKRFYNRHNAASWLEGIEADLRLMSAVRFERKWRDGQPDWRC